MSALTGDRTADAAAILDLLHERVVRYRVSDHRITYCNSSWAELHGAAADDVIGRILDDFLSDDGTRGLRRQLELLGPDRPVVADAEPRSPITAPDLWLQWVDQYVEGSDGPEVLSVGRDVTERHDAQLRLEASEARFRALADNSFDVVWRVITRPAPRFEYISPSVQALTGWSPHDFLVDFTHLIEITAPDDRPAIENTVAGTHRLGTFDLRLRCRDGGSVICETSATRLGDVVQGVSRDVTEQRSVQAHLTALATHDQMTGLPNRRLLMQMLGAALADLPADRQVSVAYVDLDDLKEINDRHGHQAGDRLIVEVGNRLRDAVRNVDVVARIGGDEFVVVMESKRGFVRDTHDWIDWVLAHPINVGGHVVHARASVGVASTGDTGDDPESLLAAADARMYEMKRTRRPADRPHR